MVENLGGREMTSKAMRYRDHLEKETERLSNKVFDISIAYGELEHALIDLILENRRLKEKCKANNITW